MSRMSRTQCECINVKHSPRCKNTATRRCKRCGDLLCKTCARKHHAHPNTEPIETTQAKPST